MNLILLNRDEAKNDRVELSDRRGRHIARVLNAKAGDELRVGVVRGPIGSATVRGVDGDRVELSIALAGPAPIEPNVDIVLAMPRPKELSRILQTAASFGVGRVDVINAWRVDKSYLQSKRLEPERLRDALVLGCEQGSTTWLPDIAVHPMMMPFIDEQLAPRFAADAPLGLLAHAHASRHVEEAAAQHKGRIIVAIGPEGGWIQRELDTFETHGFASVSLGPRILRTHAAVAGLLAQLDMLARTRG